MDMINKLKKRTWRDSVVPGVAYPSVRERECSGSTSAIIISINDQLANLFKKSKTIIIMITNNKKWSNKKIWVEEAAIELALSEKDMRL